LKDLEKSGTIQGFFSGKKRKTKTNMAVNSLSTKSHWTMQKDNPKKESIIISRSLSPPKELLLFTSHKASTVALVIEKQNLSSQERTNLVSFSPVFFFFFFLFSFFFFF